MHVCMYPPIHVFSLQSECLNFIVKKMQKAFPSKVWILRAWDWFASMKLGPGRLFVTNNSCSDKVFSVSLQNASTKLKLLCEIKNTLCLLFLYLPPQVRLSWKPASLPSLENPPLLLLSRVSWTNKRAADLSLPMCPTNSLLTAHSVPDFPISFCTFLWCIVCIAYKHTRADDAF